MSSDNVTEALMSSKNIKDAMHKMNIDTTNKRYDLESSLLGYLAGQQLNSEKNKVKGKFEDFHYDEILCLLKQELDELEGELLNVRVDFRRTFDELGDVAACLTGLLAWLNKHKDIK